MTLHADSPPWTQRLLRLYAAEAGAVARRADAMAPHFTPRTIRLKAAFRAAAAASRRRLALLADALAATGAAPPTGAADPELQYLPYLVAEALAHALIAEAERLRAAYDEAAGEADDPKARATLHALRDDARRALDLLRDAAGHAS